jgi:sulfonate transport system substrate-binding protein
MPSPRRLLPALAAAVLFAIAACSGAPKADGPVDLSSVTLRVGDQAGIQQALLRASGVLDGTPYKVSWAEFPAAAPVLQALQGGAIDIGVAGDAPTLNALAATSDITVVAANRSPKRGGLAVVVPKDSPIRTVADLRGHTVSPTTQGSIGHYLLLQALGEAGLSANDVKISFLQPVDAAAALCSGAIDAWSTWDPYTAVAQTEQGDRVVGRRPGGAALGPRRHPARPHGGRRAAGDRGQLPALRRAAQQDRGRRAHSGPRRHRLLMPNLEPAPKPVKGAPDGHPDHG